MAEQLEELDQQRVEMVDQAVVVLLVLLLLVVLEIHLLLVHLKEVMEVHQLDLCLLNLNWVVVAVVEQQQLEKMQ